MAKKESGCSFCGRSREEVGILIAGVSGHICENCIEQAHTIIQEEDVNASSKKEGDVKKVTVLKPTQIKEKLDEYVIGQDDAKKVIAVAFFLKYALI